MNADYPEDVLAKTMEIIQNILIHEEEDISDVQKADAIFYEIKKGEGYKYFFDKRKERIKAFDSLERKVLVAIDRKLKRRRYR